MLSFANAASDGKFIYLFGGRTTSQASSAIATLWRLDTSQPVRPGRAQTFPNANGTILGRAF